MRHPLPVDRNHGALKMQRFIALLCLWCILSAQDYDDILKKKRSGRIIAAGGSVTLRNNQFVTGGCTNGSSTCTLTSAVIGTTGDAALAAIQFGGNSGVSQTGCTVTASDGVNTFNTVTAASGNGATTVWYIAVLVATNATAGTRTITFTIAGAGCTFNFATSYFADFLGANTSTPVDPISSFATAASAGPATVTSTGNIAVSGEVAYSLCALLNGPTFTGAGGGFSVLDNVATTQKSLDLVNPSSGATVTPSETLSASGGTWLIDVLVIRP